MSEITPAAVDAALATLSSAPDTLLQARAGEITALQVRAQAKGALADGAKPQALAIVRPEAPVSTPNLFADSNKLDEALQQGQAAYEERVGRLEKMGVLVAGRKLPLVVPVKIGDHNVDALPITGWGQMADTIRRDESLRRALAALDAPNGLPLIQPDLRAGSLKRQVETGQMQTYPTFDLNGDATGNLVPFGFDEKLLMGDEEARRAAFTVLAKKFLLESGRLHTDGHLGLSFMDAGTEVPHHTLGMNMFTAVADARKFGLHVVAPETYVGAQQLDPGKLDNDLWTWMDGYDIGNGGALCAFWRRDSRGLVLGPGAPRRGGSDLGVRREARASGEGLEI